MIQVTKQQLADRLAHRPPEYLRDLAPALVRMLPDGGAEYDETHPAWQAALAKYRPARAAESAAPAAPDPSRCRFSTCRSCADPAMCSLDGSECDPGRLASCPRRQ